MKTLFVSFVVLFIGLPSINLYGQDANAEKLYKKGVEAYEKGDYEQAMAYFVDAIEASEAFVESTFSYLGKSYYALQKQDLGLSEEAELEEETTPEKEAEAISEKTDGTPPETDIEEDEEADDSTVSNLVAANSAYQGGVAAYKQSDFVGAIQYFTIVIEAGEGNIENAFNYRGMSYHALEDYSAAIADYDSTIALDAKSHIAHHNRGIAKQNLKLYNEALLDFNKTIRIKPSYARAYESRAVLYYKMRDLEKALKDCDKILQMDANNANALRLKEKLEEESK